MVEVMVMSKKKDTNDSLSVLVFIILVLATLVYLLIKRRAIFLIILIILILGIVIWIINIYMKSNEKNEGSNFVNKNLEKINLKSEKVDNTISTRKKDYKYDEKLEKKMNDYSLEDWQKDLVRKR